MLPSPLSFILEPVYNSPPPPLPKRRDGGGEEGLGMRVSHLLPVLFELSVPVSALGS